MLKPPSPELSGLFVNPKKDEKDLQKQVSEFIKNRKKLNAAKELLDELKKREEELEGPLHAEMMRRQIKTITHTTGIKVTAALKHSFTIMTEKKEEFFKFLKKRGEGNLITSTVNYQTLNGHMNKLVESAESALDNRSIKQAEKTLEQYKQFVAERKEAQIKIGGLKENGPKTTEA